MKHLVKSIFILVLSYHSLSADSIELSNHDKVSGRIWKISKTDILIETPYGEYLIPIRNVFNIQFLNMQRSALLRMKDGELIYGNVISCDQNGIHFQNEEIDKNIPYTDVEEVHFEENVSQTPVSSGVSI